MKDLKEQYMLPSRITATLPFLPPGPMGRLAVRVLGTAPDAFLTEERLADRLAALVSDGKLRCSGEGEEAVYQSA